MKVFLVHGMGRSRASLLLLRHRLRSAGLEPHAFGYWVSRETFAQIVARFIEVVASCVRSNEPYAIGGHSLGGVVARAASIKLPAGLSRLVLLGTPNSSPALARTLRSRRAFQLLTGDCGQSLADPTFYASLPVPAVPTLVFAGTAGPKARWLPLGEADSDGVVTVDEARLPGARIVEVPCFHTFIMNDREVGKTTVEFLLGHSTAPS
jgi:pimeloyl-ACP methyl ester carboxylesterase